MRGFFLALSLMLSSGLEAETSSSVDFARVTVEKRAGQDWCRLEAQVSGTVRATIEKVRAVIEGYESYPLLFPRIQEVRVEKRDGAVLLSEVVVISAMGVVNTNRFTLKIVTTEPKPHTVHSAWSQEQTDGSIDSLEGAWLLEDVGTAQAPLVKVSYRSQSAVPVKVPGQDVVIGMFLGAETRAVVDAVFKKALSR